MTTIRRKLRQNKFFHHWFDPSIENSEGGRYYEGVYSFNQVDDGEDDSNLYEYIVGKGLYKEIRKREQITHLRTGFDPNKQR